MQYLMRYPFSTREIVTMVGASVACVSFFLFKCGRGTAAVSKAIDAIVVPGGGLTADGSVTPWVKERLHKAKEVYESFPEGARPVIITLSGGTPHKPYPVNPANGFQVLEAEAGARYLIKFLGMPPQDILEENLSLDTIGNAFFLRIMHTDVVGLRRLIVITNHFHAPRTKAIFEKVFSLPPLPQHGLYEVSFAEVPDTGLSADTLQQRSEREAASKVTFEKNAAKIHDMAALHKFLFQDHNAYASKRCLADREPVSEAVRRSY
eukprot:gnl/MRDRNA2_/MRDRNA2_133771_c0_seq1.p1 gnl/MRDRNA2_/MRDRNA2_133771_c0~~gnl/MRDRNA2_/MRDRNA2_133771_c0_seq1.p1  ORF type:complete len:264 (-),score=36.58 gnl/MRDRNA2_/MRDRNA2_133771_c0_seq1:77-868(-)